MILPSVFVLGANLMIPVADGVPTINVEQVCQGIAVQGGSSFRDYSGIAKEKQNCLQSEKEVRDQLVQRWSSFSPSDKTACINEAEMGGDSSYTELLTCLEMAQDVRDLANESNTATPARPRPKPKR
jgi:hypothetical protein